MLKKIGIGVSLFLNLMVASGLAWRHWHTPPPRIVTRTSIELGHDRAVSQFELLGVEAGDVVFLGDSITSGGRWNELFPGVPTRNRGIAGDLTSSVLSRLRQVTEGKPSKVFLKIGTNDLHARVPEEEISSNVGTIVDRIRADAGARVYVQSVLPRGADWREAIESLNERLRATAETHGATWVDLYPLFLDPEDGSIRDELTNDELHLLGAGYLVWRNFIEPLVREKS